MRDDAAINELIFQQVGDFSRGTPVVKVLDGFLALIKPLSEKLVEICHTNRDTKKSESI